MKTLKCYSLYDAKELLKENNVSFDMTYKDIFTERDGCKSLGFIYYFNDGDSSNIAYFAEILEVLCIFDVPRIDGTPQEKRHYYL